MRPWIEQIVSTQLDAMQEAGPSPTSSRHTPCHPVLVICDCSASLHDRADFQHRSAVLLDFTHTLQNRSPTTRHARLHAELVTDCAPNRDSLLGEVVSKHGDDVTTRS